MLKPIALLCVTTCLSVTSAASMAGMLTTPAIADSHIGAGQPTQNQGARGVLYVGFPGATFKSLLQFSIAGIPANQTIDSAVLKLAISENGTAFFNTSGRTIDVRRLLVSWTEGTGVSNSNDPGTPGVTWNDRDKATIGGLPDWTAPGASSNDVDRSGTVTTTVGAANVSGGILSIDVTSDVALWYGGASNFGWLLEENPTPALGFNTTYVGFGAREQSAVADPVLEVTYSPIPEPSSMLIAFLGVGGAVLMRTRKRGRTVAN